jgi:hypothetical protein
MTSGGNHVRVPRDPRDGDQPLGLRSHRTRIFAFIVKEDTTARPRSTASRRTGGTFRSFRGRQRFVSKLRGIAIPRLRDHRDPDDVQ